MTFGTIPEQQFAASQVFATSNNSSASDLNDLKVAATVIQKDLEQGQTDDQPGKHWYGNLLLALNSTSLILRLWAYDIYGHLFSIVALANTATLITVIVRNIGHENTQASLGFHFSTAAFANLTLAVLIRQDWVKNVLFTICWSIPHSAPLWLRRRLVMIYELGGVHSSAAVCSFAWLVAFSAWATYQYATRLSMDTVLLVFQYSLVAVVATVILCALPPIRRLWHNTFERSHRFGGWLGIASFWIALVVSARDQFPDAGQATEVHHVSILARKLTSLPSFWLLLLTTCCIVWPWLRLRKVAVSRVEYLSDHAIRVYFAGEAVAPMRTLSISTAPLHEWHAFAAIDSKTDGASCIISRAGDWTSRQISSPALHYYMRGTHTTGMVYLARMFRRVVFVATGSGIGPCLGLFAHMPHTQCKIIWSAADPLATFGKSICESVYSADPHAIVWDTKRNGRPDLVALSSYAYETLDAEALFLISNRGLTIKLIAELRKCGVRAYAPNFDS